MRRSPNSAPSSDSTPSNATAHRNLDNALQAQGMHDEGFAEYRSAIRLKPDDVLAHHNLGVALERSR